MIHIKRITIITSIIIVGIFISVLFLKQSKLPEQVAEIIKEEEKISEHIDDSEDETEKAVVAEKEDPVRAFLSEKLEKAVNFFFTQEINVVTLGDSLTEGIGDETKNSGYVGILDETINKEEQIVQFDNFAKRGSRSGQLLSRLEDDEVVKKLKNADITLITIGANDIMQVFKENITNLTLEKFTQEQIRYEQRLINILSQIQAINEHTDIFLIGFYNPFEEYFAQIEELDYIVDSWNQIGSDVTMQYDNTYFIPIKDLFENAQVNYFADDNFHPNHLGYKLIAERILQYVMNEGEYNDEMEGANE